MRPGRLALCELAVLLMVLGVAHLAAGSGDSRAHPLLRANGLPPPAARCPAAQKAIGHYRRAYTRSRSSMGLSGAPPRAWYPCQAARRRATEWRGRAEAAKRELDRWTAYHWNWRSWLPAGWQAIARCETGLRWDWNSGAYQGSFGFAVSSWDAFVGSADPKAGPYPSEAYLATPRQQYEVALAIYRRYGLTGWGCRGAFYGA